jgi:hypothetical protein
MIERDKLISLRADAALGAMVRRMPSGQLTHWTRLDPRWSFHAYDCIPNNDRSGDTPESVLQEVATTTTTADSSGAEGAISPR